MAAVLAILVTPLSANELLDAGSHEPLPAIEIDLTRPNAMSRLNGLDLDLLELRSGHRAVALGWPGTRQLLDEVGLCYTPLSSDYGAELAERSRADRIPPVGVAAAADAGAVPPFASGSLAGFWTVDEVYALMDSLAGCDSLALLTDVVTIGTSLQGRPIRAIGVVNENLPPGSRPEVLLTSLTHAREPQGMQTILYFLLQLMENYGIDPALTYLVDNREIWFVPIVNPDGYIRNENTWASTGSFGFWRKNLRDNDGNSILDGFDGVDLNRNFGYEWGYDNFGSSPNPQSQTYRGTGAFSEPESQALRDFCVAHTFRTANNLHSYYEAVLYPWGHVAQPSPDNDTFVNLVDALTQENKYAYGFSDQILYPVNGDADDWMYGDETSKPKTFAMTSEVGRLDDGFWPVPSRIVDLAEENLHSLAVLSYAADVYLRPGEAVIESDDGYLRPGSVEAMVLDLNHLGVGGSTAGGVTVRVISTAPELTFLDDTALYPNLSGGDSSGPEPGDRFWVRLDPSAVPGELVQIDLVITDGAGYAGTDAVFLRVGEPLIVFSDDAETGLANWTTSGSWGIETDGLNTWFADSPGNNYPNNADQSLTLGFGLDLTGGTRAVLCFQSRWNIEGGYDFGMVEVSGDGAQSWTPLGGRHTVAGEGGFGAYTGGEQPMGEPGYEANRRVWTREELDLSGYVGLADVRIRFRLVSDAGLNMEGWDIDDVVVRAYSPASLSADSQPLPPSLSLLAASPNPFREQTRIVYSVPQASAVTVSVYDVSGRRVRVLTSGITQPGEKMLLWDGRSTTGAEVPAGIYYVRVETPAGAASNKVTLVH